MSATPNYQGSGQAVADNGGGLLGFFSGIFGGGGTPAYSGDGQPSSSASGGFLGGGTPAYQAAPPPPPPPPTTQTATATMECPQFDPDPFGSGPIAIVIPRQG